MRYTEELSWILDKAGTTLQTNEEKIRENIAFVHELGLKCDSVGWCKLDLTDPQVPEVFQKISAFCKERGWTARCSYKRTYIDVESEWFELTASPFKDNTIADRMEAVTEQGEKLNIRTIRAFHEHSVGPKHWGKDLLVPERFRTACIRNGFALDFCWAKDIGKYDAEQYFYVYGKHLIPRIAVDFDLKHSEEQLRAAGGWLPQITEVFHTLQFVNLPDCHLSEDLPQQGIVYAHIPMTNSCAGRNTILIHQDTADALLREKALPVGALRPVPVVDALPDGYVLQETQPIPRPSRAFMDSHLAEYEQLKRKVRPIRAISEKEALKLLRSAKKERKEDFRKAMSKADAQLLVVPAFAPVLPYYLIANGGFLSDEYELLPYSKAVTATEEFRLQVEAESLADKPPDGVVIAVCPDGDNILLCGSGTVIRFSHEAPEVTEEWTSPAQFIADACNG